MGNNQNSENQISDIMLEKGPSSYSLDPYTGEWGYQQAAHLLRRTLLGVSNKLIIEAEDGGLNSTMDSLLEELDIPEPPVYFNFNQDPNAGNGETWVNAPFIPDLQGQNGRRRQSLFAWSMGLMLEDKMNIRENMVLFWHNHFVTAGINDPRVTYRYLKLLQENALGNFKQFVKDITIEPAMLLYLNGNQNTKAAPNENYARELLELFTIGKGDLAGPGDYTTFTEQDVEEIAKILTGWRLNINNGIPSDISSIFIPNRHDQTQKQLSHRFNNKVINNNGENEYSDLIDIIFEQKEVARFICREIYKWFIYYEIDEQVENLVIEGMADILIANDYEILPVLSTLLRSEHFFDEAFYGIMIRNPLDFACGLIKQLDVELPEALVQKYVSWISIRAKIEGLQMSFLNPPSVAGWTPYYQEPGYYQLWINSVTLPIRFSIASELTTNGYVINQADVLIKVDHLKLIEQIENNTDPNDLIQGLASFLFPKSIHEAQITNLKEVLIPGLPDYEWTTEYAAYLNDPDNEALKMSIENKLKGLLSAMVVMPEFQLS